MKRAVGIVLWLQIALGALWTYSVLTADNSSWGPLVALVYTYPPQIVFFFFAAGVFWKRRDLRRPAGWIMALPVVLLFTPTGLRTLVGGRVDPSSFVSIAVVAALLVIVYGLIRPRSAAKVVPQQLLRNRVFNGVVILLQVFGWLLPLILFAYWTLESQGGPRSTDAGTGLAYLLILAVIYLAGLGIGSLLVSCIAWVGLRGGIDNAPRKLHIAQLVIAVPGVLLGAGAIIWLAVQGS